MTIICNLLDRKAGAGARTLPYVFQFLCSDDRELAALRSHVGRHVESGTGVRFTDESHGPQGTFSINLSCPARCFGEPGGAGPNVWATLADLTGMQVRPKGAAMEVSVPPVPDVAHATGSAPPRAPLTRSGSLTAAVRPGPLALGAAIGAAFTATPAVPGAPRGGSGLPQARAGRPMLPHRG